MAQVYGMSFHMEGHFDLIFVFLCVWYQLLLFIIQRKAIINWVVRVVKHFLFCFILAYLLNLFKFSHHLIAQFLFASIGRTFSSTCHTFCNPPFGAVLLSFRSIVYRFEFNVFVGGRGQLRPTMQMNWCVGCGFLHWKSRKS